MNGRDYEDGFLVSPSGDCRPDDVGFAACYRDFLKLLTRLKCPLLHTVNRCRNQNLFDFCALECRLAYVQQFFRQIDPAKSGISKGVSADIL